MFDASDGVTKSGDDEEADEIEPVETVDLGELRGRVTSWGLLSLLTDVLLPRVQSLPSLDDLDYKVIVPTQGLLVLGQQLFIRRRPQ